MAGTSLQQRQPITRRCIHFLRSETPSPALSRRPPVVQRRAPRRASCAGVTQTAESALQVRPATVEAGRHCSGRHSAPTWLRLATKDFDESQGGTFTVRGSLETACQPEAIYQTLIDYANLPTVFKNLDSCRSWTESGQKKLLQVTHATLNHAVSSCLNPHCKHATSSCISY